MHVSDYLKRGGGKRKKSNTLLFEEYSELLEKVNVM